MSKAISSGQIGRLVGVALVTIVVLAGCATVSWAQWEQHPEWPSWMHRGTARWFGAGRYINPERMQWFQDLHVNALACSSPRGLETENAKPEYFQTLRDHDIHCYFYLCASSIFFDDLILKHAPKLEPWQYNWFMHFPYLKDGAVRGPEGEYSLIYNYPGDRGGFTRRRKGCFNSPVWREHKKKQMTWYIKGADPFKDDEYFSILPDLALKDCVDIFFFDNSSILPCYCDHCKSAWAEYSRQHLGRVVEHPESSEEPRVRNTWKMFWQDCAADYHLDLKAHAHSLGKPLMHNLVGLVQYYLLSKDVGDVVFFENTGTHAPWGRNYWAYKLALAASGGKSICNLTYLGPPHFANVSLTSDERPVAWYPQPLYTQMALAEGAACQASYELVTDEGRGDYQEGTTRYNKFIERNAPLLEEASPGARVALLVSLRDLVMHAFPPADEIAGLGRAGMPFEVIVENNLDAETLGHYDLIIAPNAPSMSDAHAQELASWVEAGGVLLANTACGSCDEWGVEVEGRAVADALARLKAESGQVAVLPVNLEMEGFEPERGSTHVWLSWRKQVQEGTLTYTHDGPAGDYVVSAKCTDETDGQSQVAILVDGREVKRWVLDDNDNSKRWLSTPAVGLKPGAQVQVWGKCDGGEYVRIWEVRILPAGAEAKHAAAELGEGKVVYRLERLSEMEPGAVREMLAEVAAKTYAAVESPDETDILVTALRDPAGAIDQYHVVNFGVELRRAPALFMGDQCVARKSLRLDAAALEALKQPVLRLCCVAGGSEFEVVAKINGQEVARVSAEEIAKQTQPTLGRGGKQWIDLPIERAALKEQNEVEVRVSGNPGLYPNYFVLYIDKTRQGASAFSADGGTAFVTDDLSPVRGEQRGEFMMEIADAEDELPPTMEPVLAPASNLRLRIPVAPNEELSAALISPDHAPAKLTVEQDGDYATVSIPSCEVWEIVLVSRDREALERAVALNGG